MILSILHTAHPTGFQPRWVRPSRGCYPSFSLAMRSSRGFASTAPDYGALFRLAFASAPCQRHLTWPVTVSRRIIMQKARRHPGSSREQKTENRGQKNSIGCPSVLCLLSSVLCSTRWAPTACRHVVSGSLSSPYRGSSHLSLALLGSLSVAREYLALRDGPRRFRLASTCRVLLRCRIESLPLSPTGLSPALVRLSRRFGLSTNSLNTGPTTPRRQVLWVWAVPRSLAATDGVAVAFFSWGY